MNWLLKVFWNTFVHWTHTPAERAQLLIHLAKEAGGWLHVHHVIDSETLTVLESFNKQELRRSFDTHLINGPRKADGGLEWRIWIARR